jgi:hypothetical protein
MPRLLILAGCAGLLFPTVLSAGELPTAKPENVGLFLDKERPPGMRGSGGRPGCPGFEVTLQAADLAVTEAHLVS